MNSSCLRLSHCHNHRLACLSSSSSPSLSFSPPRVLVNGANRFVLGITGIPSDFPDVFKRYRSDTRFPRAREMLYREDVSCTHLHASRARESEKIKSRAQLTHLAGRPTATMISSRCRVVSRREGASGGGGGNGGGGSSARDGGGHINNYPWQRGVGKTQGIGRRGWTTEERKE